MIKDTLVSQQEKQPSENSSRSIGLRLKENDLAVLNHRFKLDGFENLSGLVRSYLNGEITKSAKPDMLSRLLLRLKEKNITDPLTGEVNPLFYKKIDIDDFRQYLRTKYKYSKYGDNLVKYYQRFAEFFFTKPEIVRAESGRNRSWICDAMRRFGEYYDYKHQNPEMKMLVKEVIERYEINRHMRMHITTSMTLGQIETASKEQYDCWLAASCIWILQGQRKDLAIQTIAQIAHLEIDVPAKKDALLLMSLLDYTDDKIGRDELTSAIKQQDIGSDRTAHILDAIEGRDVTIPVSSHVDKLFAVLLEELLHQRSK